MFKSTSDMQANDKVIGEFTRKLTENFVKVDRWLARLLLLQWVAAIITALVCSPFAWNGAEQRLHQHVWLAIGLGALLSVPSWYVAKILPGRLPTRFLIATSQVLFSSLFIHITAGRIETHFHVFVGMAFLVAYRDRTVFLPAVLVVLIDHLVRGIWWPQSVFGEFSFDLLRPFEHAFWLLLETGGLCFIVGENLKEWMQNSRLQCELANERDHLESRILVRTKQLTILQQFREEILNSIDACICILNSHGRIVFVNRKWSEMAREAGMAANCGLGSSYLSECGFSQIGSPEFSETVAENIRLVSTGEIDTFCSEYVSDFTGETRHYRLSISPIALDGELGVAIVHVEVTHLKRAERRASALAKLVLESPDEVLIASSETGRFVEVNGGAVGNTGYQRSELLMMSLEQLFDATQAEVVKNQLRQLENQGTGVARFESAVIRKDKTVYPCNISLHRAHFEDIDVWVLFINDLTEHKRLQNKLQQARKLESLGTLAAGIAHEINTPMQCVVGNVEFLQNSLGRVATMVDEMLLLLQKENCDWEPERQRLLQLYKESKQDYLRKQTPLAVNEAAEASRRIVSIVRAMKAMSHPGTEDAVPTDLHELIQNASILSRNHWKLVAEVSFDFSPEVATIEAFPSELNQVFLNLFVNATDAIVEKIGPNPSELGRISVSTRLSGNMVSITVSDTGCGMSAAVRQRIFDPFFTTKEVGKGTGQGLAITQNVIEKKHNGSIFVSSQLGVGTKFTLELPIKHRTKLNDCTAMPVDLQAVSSVSRVGLVEF